MNNMPYTYRVETPAEELWLTFSPSEILIRCDVTPPDHAGCCVPGFAETSVSPPPGIRDAIEEIHRYFQGTLREFSLPFAVQGTDFQKSVWEQAREIPYGETCSYGDLAKALGSPGSARAAGRALGKNPLLLVIPCHRVLTGTAGLGGYRGGRRMKRFLLDHEARHQMP